MTTGGGWRARKVPGSRSACSASLGRSRVTNPWSGNSRRIRLVFPVCRAPVSTTTGRVAARCNNNGSIWRSIHIV